MKSTPAVRFLKCFSERFCLLIIGDTSFISNSLILFYCPFLKFTKLRAKISKHYWIQNYIQHGTITDILLK